MSSVTAPLPVDELAVLRKRCSAKWRTYPPDVLPLTISEIDFPIAEPIAEVLREAVSRSDTGYAMPTPDLGEAVAGFAAARWGWPVDPDWVTAVTDVSIGCVELLRACCRPGEAVVISPPVYPPFFEWVAEVGARLIEAPLRQDGSGIVGVSGTASDRAMYSSTVAASRLNPGHGSARQETASCG
jgi:cysteine-S-conjugate beta-lyase